MSKYIDADALIKDIENCSYETWSKGVNRDWWAQAVKVKDNIKRCIERQPTADVVEVVRCKDCKYFTEEMIGDDLEGICKSVSGMINPVPDFYCSYGERRTENEE